MSPVKTGQSTPERADFPSEWNGTSVSTRCDSEFYKVLDDTLSFIISTRACGHGPERTVTEHSRIAIGIVNPKPNTRRDAPNSSTCVDSQCDSRVHDDPQRVTEQYDGHPYERPEDDTGLVDRGSR